MADLEIKRGPFLGTREGGRIMLDDKMKTIAGDILEKCRQQGLKGDRLWAFLTVLRSQQDDLSGWYSEQPGSKASADCAKDGLTPADIYQHFKYFEAGFDVFRYEDDGFPSGEYTTELGPDSPKALARLTAVLDNLRKDRRIRLVIDYDPDFPVAMARFWGTYKPEIQARVDAEESKRRQQHL